eukprot:1014875-Pleurochrysis_carterae.AAC.3
MCMQQRSPHVTYCSTRRTSLWSRVGSNRPLGLWASSREAIRATFLPPMGDAWTQKDLNRIQSRAPVPTRASTLRERLPAPHATDAHTHSDLCVPQATPLYTDLSE